MLYSAVVSKVDKWSRIGIWDLRTSESWRILPNGRPNHHTKCQWNPFNFAVILLTNTRRSGLTSPVLLFVTRGNNLWLWCSKCLSCGFVESLTYGTVWTATLLMHPAWTISKIDWIKLGPQGWVSSWTGRLNRGPCHVRWPQDKATQGKHS